MKFVPPSAADWQLFLDWARAENWRVPEQEQRLFLGRWRPYFFALKIGGAAQGFVSARPYHESGWIGNLLVDPERRGQGFGAALFDFALGFLRQLQLPRIWLTASPSGLPLYQRRGFVGVDRIERWQGSGLGRAELQKIPLLSELIRLDQECWGEFRGALLIPLAEAGEICRAGNSLAVLQPGTAAWQLGPWLAAKQCPRKNHLLLNEALARTPAGRTLLMDVPVSAELGQLLRSAGFARIANNELMCLSRQPVRLDGVLALASLGSIG